MSASAASANPDSDTASDSLTCVFAVHYSGEPGGLDPQQMTKMCDAHGLRREDLGLDLGPLGTLLADDGW